MTRRSMSVLATASIYAALSLPSFADVQNLSAESAHKLVQRGELILLDVRTPSEWAMTGMPRDSVGANVKDVDFLAQARGAVLGDLEYPIAVICRAGNRSTLAAAQLEAAGFAEIYEITEGMAGLEGIGDGWIKRGLPTDQFLPPDR
jgi:rhodanese-related sulfurtransferase